MITAEKLLARSICKFGANLCGWKLPTARPKINFAQEGNGQTEEVGRCREMFQERNQRLLKEARGVDENLPEAEKWTAEETAILYEKSMTWCAEIARKSGSVEEEGSRQKLWSEYKEFLSKNAFGVTVETANAEDVLAFIRGYWIPRHFGRCRTTVGESNSKVVAMSGDREAGGAAPEQEL
jgi:hypothetical protein